MPRSSLDQRRAAADRFRPDRTRLLLIAEAPPCDTDRYFYFPDVDRHDWLFRYVWEGLTGAKPDRADKPQHLAALQAAGVFLIDLHEANIAQPKRADLTPHIPALIERCRALKPERIILIKSIVHDAAYQPLKAAGLPVIDARIPFPASGQQKKFLELFRAAIGKTTFHMKAATS